MLWCQLGVCVCDVDVGNLAVMWCPQSHRATQPSFSATASMAIRERFLKKRQILIQILVYVCVCKLIIMKHLRGNVDLSWSGAAVSWCWPWRSWWTCSGPTPRRSLRDSCQSVASIYFSFSLAFLLLQHVPLSKPAIKVNMITLSVVAEGFRATSQDCSQ